MAVAFDALSESHTGTTGSASQASFSWTHTPAASPQSVIVFVMANSATNPVTSVTYGGTTMIAVSGGTAACSSAEPGAVAAYFLDSPPTGTQTIVVNRTNNATVMYATAYTVTAAGPTEVYTPGIATIGSASTVASGEVNVDDGSPGTNSLRFAGVYTGAVAPIAAGTNSTGTTTTSIDLGAQGFESVRETTAGQGSRPVGLATGTTDDEAFVGLAIREIPTIAVSVSDSTATTTESLGLIGAPIVYTPINTSELVALQDPSPTSISDTAMYSETVTAAVQPTFTPQISVSDAVGHSESVTVALASSGLAVNVADSAATSETLTLQVPSPTSVSDSVNHSESVTATLTSFVSVSDATAITETRTLQNPSPLTVSDSASATETVALQAPSPIGPSDSASVSESVTVSLPGPVLTISVSDAATVTESFGTISRPIVYDPIDTSEFVQVVIPASFSPNVSDTVGHTESVNVQVNTIPSDAVSVSDSTSASEWVVVAFDPDVTFTLEVSVSDSVATSESANAQINTLPPQTVGVSNSVGVAENVTLKISDAHAAVSDSTSASELVSVQLLPAGSPPNTHPPLGGTFNSETVGGTVNTEAAGGTISNATRGGTVTVRLQGGTANNQASGGTVRIPSQGGNVLLPDTAGDIE